MNAPELRKYWTAKYKEIYGESYLSPNFLVDLKLLKRLLEKYDQFVVLEAIDRFLWSKTMKKPSINFFASSKVFDSKFRDIIHLTPIIKYCRFLLSFPIEIRDIASSLIEEYKGYCESEIISESEKIRKMGIESQLQNLTEEFFAKI